VTERDDQARKCDALFLGAHPDDVELACAGTILHLIGAGRRVVVVDATRGEKGSRGTQESRARECEQASQLLGLTHRANLGLPDTAVTNDEPSVASLVGVLREWRPELLFAPVAEDIHPDHRATAEIAQRAWFLSGVANAFPEAGPPHRPRILLGYPGNNPVEPSFCVDITSHAARKEQVVRAYATQVDVGDRAHLARKLDLLERMKVRDAWMGHRIGAAAGEGFVCDGPLPLGEIASLMAF